MDRAELAKKLAHETFVQGRKQYEAKEYAEAELLLVSAIEQIEKVFHKEHADAIEGREMLADTYFYLGKYDESETLYRQLLDVPHLFDNEARAVTMVKLANTFERRALYDQAASRYEHAFEFCRTHLPRDHELIGSLPVLINNARNLYLTVPSKKDLRSPKSSSTSLAGMLPTSATSSSTRLPAAKQTNPWSSSTRLEAQTAPSASQTRLAALRPSDPNSSATRIQPMQPVPSVAPVDDASVGAEIAQKPASAFAAENLPWPPPSMRHEQHAPYTKPMASRFKQRSPVSLRIIWQLALFFIIAAAALFGLRLLPHNVLHSVSGMLH